MNEVVGDSYRFMTTPTLVVTVTSDGLVPGRLRQRAVRQREGGALP